MRWDADGLGVLEFPSGRLVRGRSLRFAPDVPAEWGVYATFRPPTPQLPGEWVRWPDFALPLRGDLARRAIREAWERSPTQRVEVACGGGVGRTGTVLAAMLMLDGLDPGDAVAWVRSRYHSRAVETPWQRRWLRNGV